MMCMQHASRRISFARVALIGQFGAFCATALVILVVPSSPVQGSDIA